MVVAVELVNVKKTFESKTVLDNINLRVEEGEMVLIEGKSGEGKSTLLNLMAALDKPTENDIYIYNKNIVSLSEDERASIRLNTIGIVFQSYNLIVDLTVLENIALPLKLAKKPWKERSHYLLSFFGIEELEKKKPNILSGGESQRIGIARALANDPKILLADEPTSNLDNESSDKVIEMFKKINEEFGTTVIIVTHDPRMLTITSNRYVLRDGKLMKYENNR